MQQIILALIFLSYLIVLGFLVERPLVVFFSFKKSFRTKLIGVLAGFQMVTFISGLTAAFYVFNLFSQIAIFLLPFLLFVGLYLWAHHNEFLAETKINEKIEKEKISILNFSFITIFLCLVFYGFWLLGFTGRETAVNTPWSIINPQFIYIFTGAIFALGALILYKTPVRFVLPLLIFISLLQHSYLPLSNSLFYGADSWRHVSTEQRLLRGLPVSNPEITDRTTGTNVSSLVGRVAYSQLWGVTVLISKIFSVDLIVLNRWLLPILWSLFVPILLYEIGRSFGWSKRRSLVFVWLGFLPFAWQAAGSFTLPVNFGFIFWLLSLLLIFKRSENPGQSQLPIILLLGLFLTTGYTLFALLFWVAFLVFEYLRWRMEFTWTQVGLMVLGVALLLPTVEWKFGYTFIPENWQIFSGFKQLLGSFSAYYFSSGPRPHDISAGNIILNEAPSYAFVSNLFTGFKDWLVAVMLAFWGVFIYGLYVVIIRGFESLPDLPGNARVNIRRYHYCWLLVFGVGIFFGYIFSRYFLSGENLLTRRLDVVLAFVFLLISIVAFSGLALGNKNKKILLIFFAVISIFIGASYSLGPDSRTVSADEYRAIKYIASEEIDKDKHCVIGDTYPLLALESVSLGEIVGGGFPISHNFEQPELLKLQMNLEDISIIDVRSALNLTGAGRCWLVTKTNGQISYYIKNGNSTSAQFGAITVWKYSN